VIANVAEPVLPFKAWKKMELIFSDFVPRFRQGQNTTTVHKILDAPEYLGADHQFQNVVEILQGQPPPAEPSRKTACV
jgi:hypothetical protein